MAVFLQDSFVNTSGSNVPLNGRPADVGGVWRYTPLRLTSGSGIPAVYPEQHVRSPSLNRQLAYNDIAPSIANVRVSADLSRFFNDTGAQGGLVWCVNPATDTCYYIRWNNQQCILWKVTNNTGVQVAQTAVSAAIGLPVLPAVVRAEVTYSDGLISVYRNGTLILTYQDPSPLPLGFTGLTVSGPGVVDNFLAETLASVPTPTTATSAGTSTATGTTTVTRSVMASAAGTSSGTAISFKFQTGFGNSVSAATVSGVGLTINFREATGTSVAGAVADFEGVTGSTKVTVGTSAGSSTGEFFTDLTETGTGTAAGSSTVFGTGRSIFTAAFAVVGATVVDGVAREFGTADGVVAAGSQSDFRTGYIQAVTGRSQGVATVVGSTFLGSIGRSNGVATTIGRTDSVSEGVAQAGGTSVSDFITTGILDIRGQSEGGSQANGVGHQIIEVLAQSAGSSDSYVLSLGLRIFPVNPDRVLRLAAEDRMVVLLAEDRSITLPLNDLSAQVDTETRLVILPAEEPREVILEPEDRSLTLAAEDRMIVL